MPRADHTEVFDLERAPEVFLDLILADLGNPFPFDLDELDKRRLDSILGVTTDLH